MELHQIVQGSVELRKQFVMELSAKVKHFSCGQYEENSPEMLAFQDGVATAIGMMSIDLLGGVKTRGMLEKFTISSQISLLEEELERKEKTRRDENFYLRDAVSIVEEDISYLQDQITKCKELN